MGKKLLFVKIEYGHDFSLLFFFYFLPLSLFNVVMFIIPKRGSLNSSTTIAAAKWHQQQQVMREHKESIIISLLSRSEIHVLMNTEYAKRPKCNDNINDKDGGERSSGWSVRERKRRIEKNEMRSIQSKKNGLVGDLMCSLEIPLFIYLRC